MDDRRPAHLADAAGRPVQRADRHPTGAADLAAVRKIRDHTARALDHIRRGERPSANDLDALNQAQRGAPAVLELTWHDGTVTATRTRTGTPAQRLAAWLAEASAELLADPAVTRIRQCEADDCVRVARHYQRHKPA